MSNPTPEREAATPNPTRRYAIEICDACIALRGEQCHEPGCVFIRCTMPEVKQALSDLLLCPVIDGERFNLAEPLAAAPSEPAIAPTWRDIAEAPTHKAIIGRYIQQPEQWLHVGLCQIDGAGEFLWLQDVPWGAPTHFMLLPDPPALNATRTQAAKSETPSAEPGKACNELTPLLPGGRWDGRSCDKPKGHDGDHWTYGGNEKTWPKSPERATLEARIRHMTGPTVEAWDTVLRLDDRPQLDPYLRAELIDALTSFGVMLTQQLPALTAAPSEPPAPDTYTPVLWASLSDDEKYAEYLRERQAVKSETPSPPRENRLSNCQGQGLPATASARGSVPCAARLDNC